MEVECCSFPDIEQYTLEQLDELIIEAQRILNARVEKTESLCRWLLLQTRQVCGRGLGRYLARRVIPAQITKNPCGYAGVFCYIGLLYRGSYGLLGFVLPADWRGVYMAFLVSAVCVRHNVSAFEGSY